MIPRPLVEPFAIPRAGRSRRRVALAIGVVLCGFSMIGLFFWVDATPIGFSRFSLRDGDRVENISQPGTYVVFEEHIGASQPALPPPLSIAVTSKGGDVIPVEPLMKPYAVDNPYAYKTPWQEGRAIARFTIDQPGLYHVRAAALRRSSSGAGYGPRTVGTIAIGREATVTWLGSWAGLVVLCGLPLVCGLVAIGIDRRAVRQRAIRPPTSREPRQVSGSLTAHG